VVIETPNHEQEMALRTPEQLLLTLRAWQERVRALHARKDIRHIVIFKNHGKEAGTSLAHPHSQVVALTRIPQAVLQRTRNARAYFDRAGGCGVCETSRQEMELRERVVLESEGFLAYAPFAASSEALVRVTPLEHSPTFTDASAASLLLFSRHLRLLFSMLDTAFDSPAFNLILVMPPKTFLNDAAQHWHLDLIPRLTRPGGFEFATGLGVNTLLPEEAAKIYRQARLSLE
jgi:UDPglucose--hexose-1-phosphate uridylyltransferase